MDENATRTFTVTLPSPLNEIRHRIIEEAVELCNGNKTHAARALGIDRRTLYRILARKTRRR